MTKNQRAVRQEIAAVAANFHRSVGFTAAAAAFIGRMPCDTVTDAVVSGRAIGELYKTARQHLEDAEDAMSMLVDGGAEVMTEKIENLLGTVEAALARQAEVDNAVRLRKN